MAMDLENIMQDTIVIQARAREKKGDRGRSKKWKEILRLPPVAHSLCLREEIEHTYESLIENQPIGLSLFKDFCSKDPNLAKCHRFMHEYDDFVLVAEEKGAVTAGRIFDEYLSPQNPERLKLVKIELVTNIREKIMLLPVPKNVFNECQQTVREFLSGQPFINYVDSPYYWRYLQWKNIERGPITKNSFRVYRVLGKGGFGLVHACQSKPTGKMYALKKLEKKRVKKRKGDKLALNEKVILEKVDSRFVVTLVYAYQTKEALCMVLTLMNGGDLRFHIHNIGHPGLDMERTIFYSAEISAGLSHLHASRVAYRDMKPDNILLDDHGHVRISDLGLAVQIPEGQSVRGRVGTVGYMAPEVIDNHRYTFSPDWWGLGCMVYEMIHGECPFRKRKERVSREVVEKRVREDTPKYSDKFNPESKSFCSMLLNKVPTDRLGTTDLGFEAIKSHPFFKSINWHHLELGILEPPFKPNPRAVYAKDVLDIDAFSSIKGVEMEERDEEFAGKFATGACSKPWQQEMIETKVFDDINRINPIDTMTIDSHPEPVESERGRGAWLKRIFKFKRQSTAPPPFSSTPSPSKNRRSYSHDVLSVPTPYSAPSTPPDPNPDPPSTSDKQQQDSAPNELRDNHINDPVASGVTVKINDEAQLQASGSSADQIKDPLPDKDVHISKENIFSESCEDQIKDPLPDIDVHISKEIITDDGAQLLQTSESQNPLPDKDVHISGVAEKVEDINISSTSSSAAFTEEPSLPSKHSQSDTEV